MSILFYYDPLPIIGILFVHLLLVLIFVIGIVGLIKSKKLKVKRIFSSVILASFTTFVSDYPIIFYFGIDALKYVFGEKNQHKSAYVLGLLPLLQFVILASFLNLIFNVFGKENESETIVKV